MIRQYYFKTLLLLSAASILAGCASGPLEHNSNELDLEADSLVLFRLDTFNEYKPEHTLHANSVGVIDVNEKSENHHFLVESTEFYDKSKKTFLFNMKLKKGFYILTDILGGSTNGWINAGYSFPLYKKLHIQDQNIIYLGRVSITNIERTSGSQERSGPVIPVIDQYTAGFADGTFIAEISDKYEEDIQLFIMEYPALSGRTIDKSIFSAWNPDNKKIREETSLFRQLKYKVLDY